MRSNRVWVVALRKKQHPCDGLSLLYQATGAKGTVVQLLYVVLCRKLPGVSTVTVCPSIGPKIID